MKSTILFLLVTLIELAAARVYTGFNYGAFWSEQANAKRYADFHHGFELAKNLTNTPVPFDSARLYTCITAGTKDHPTEAFQAAIDTSTNLILGMWVSPGTTGQPNDVLVDNELTALGKAFDKYGQSLADLIIGLSVGNEDVYRFTTQQAGVGPDNLRLTIQTVREKIKAASWGEFMQGKPIGHTDTPPYVVVSDSDFIGMTAYPYWEGKSIDEANATFMATLKDTQKRAGNAPVWISEIGWPINGTNIKEAVASADNYQRLRNEVACQVFGKYNTFWFELLQDFTPDQPDWGLLDMKTYRPRIRDLSCPDMSSVNSPATENPQNLSTKPLPMNLSKIYISSSASGSTISSSSASKAISPISHTRTVHTTQTRTTTMLPTASPTYAASNEMTMYLSTTTYLSATPTLNATMPSNNGTASDDNLTACIVMMDLTGDGTYTPVATYARDLSTCTPPSRFTGSPFTMIAGPTSTDQKSSFDLYAPSPTQASIMSTAVQPNGPICVTSAGMTCGAVVLNGHTYTGGPTVPCPFSEPSAPALIVTASTPVKYSTVTSHTSSSISLAPSFSPTVSSLTTFSTMTSDRQSNLVPAPTKPQSLAPSPSLTFSHSLSWPQFNASPTSSSPTLTHSLSWTMFEPPSTSPPPTPCTNGALICAPSSGKSFWAEISNSHATIITRNGAPVPCTATNTCTWNPDPAPTPTPTCAKEGDAICLRIGVLAVIKNSVPVIASPRTACTPSGVLRACPAVASAHAVLSILGEAREELGYTSSASTTIRRSRGPAVPREPDERRGRRRWGA